MGGELSQAAGLRKAEVDKVKTIEMKPEFEAEWKVVPAHGLGPKLQMLEEYFGSIVATGGCFDLIHPGHTRLLQWAAGRGKILVVLLNSDYSVRGLKGEQRPIQSFTERAEVLSALKCVDYIVSFDEPTPEAVLEIVQPSIWVKDYRYRQWDVPEREVVERFGGAVEFAPHWSGFSTTELVRRARCG